MRSRSLGLVLSVSAASAASVACGDASVVAPRVSVVTSLTLPRGLLDRVTKLTITVLEGDARCDPQAGAVAVGAGSAKELVSKRPLGAVGCAAGAKFCGDVTLERSSAVRVFSATGTDASDATLARGCAAASASEATLAVSIKMVRYLAPAVCGDGTVQPTEQCEPGGTAVCDASCQTNEVLLSAGASSNETSSGSPGDKTDASFLWPQGTGAAGWFYAFYTDRATGVPNDTDVGMRVLDADLSPLASPPAPVAFATASLFLPNGSNGAALPPRPAPFRQALPRAATVGGKLYVAFEDDDAPSRDVHLRSMDAVGVADQGVTPLGVNGASGAGEAGSQGAPAISASASKLFVAWEDALQGKIAGRTVTPPATLGNPNDLSTGTRNTHVSVAKVSAGWVAVWQSDAAIKLRAISEDGTPSGAEQAVSEGAASATTPGVAALADGSFAVTWTAGGDVFVQRYDAQGTKLQGDQATPINDVVTSGTQRSPSIASTPSGYVVAWLDEGTSHVRARVLGAAGGFLFNNVNGQSSEFQASRSDGRTREAPTVAVGGSGPFVVIGWEDKTAPGSGIVARRFPVPTP